MRNIDGISKASGVLLAGKHSIAQVTIGDTDYLLREIKLYNWLSSQIKAMFNSKKYEIVKYLGGTWIMWEDNLKDRFGLKQIGEDALTKRYNLIVVYDQSGQKLLMCMRTDEPYKGMLNFVGGKIEQGETDEESAYRELLEETGISSDDIVISHIMTFTYHLSKVELEVYAGRLKTNVPLVEEKNKLCWVGRSENFCDMARFAGNCNMEHILQQVDYYKGRVLK